MPTPPTLIATVEITAVEFDITDPANPAYRIGWNYSATDGTTSAANGFVLTISQADTLVKDQLAVDIINTAVAKAAQAQIQGVSDWRIDLDKIVFLGLLGTAK